MTQRQLPKQKSKPNVLLSFLDVVVFTRFMFCSCDGRAKFPTGLETMYWSTSQLSLVCERATASNADLQIDTKVGFWQSFTFSSRFVRPFEWAELQLLLLGRDRSGYSRWSDELGTALRELFCLNRALPEFSGVSTFVKTQTLLVLAFAEPSL
ncbi:hypothetical protein L3X38_038761 [Prunus dulcis]|uniref:Uncharacterized protein n=2 Tax=Prunus dulcis TaxID=3755 RepID=A0AAD4V654_PRUDU|nr:hypothetical protein L3X38_038761 [Prunus dulcis]